MSENKALMVINLLECSLNDFENNILEEINKLDNLKNGESNEIILSQIINEFASLKQDYSKLIENHKTQEMIKNTNGIKMHWVHVEEFEPLRLT
ncbi:MAG: hypothetical protein QM500_20000 [Methylococcales bacterium]